ncbi:MAG: Fe-S-cluster oxidoreductase [Halioglobus sp.]
MHLTSALRCGLFGDVRRPAACTAFLPEPEFCGGMRDEALDILARMERVTRPAHAPGQPAL